MIQKLHKRTKTAAALMLLWGTARLAIAIPVAVGRFVVRTVVRDMGRSFRMTPT